MKKVYSKAFILFLIFITISCQNNVLETEEIQEEACNEEISFVTTIKPIIDTNCLQCHNGNQFPDLRTYQGINQNAEAIKNETSSRRMPFGDATITTEEIKVISCWVESGALNN